MRAHLKRLVLLLGVVTSACGGETPAVPEPPTAPAPPVAAAAEVAPPAKPWRLVHSQGIMNFVHIDEAQWKDQDQYRMAIAEICGTKTMCQVMFWKDAALVPTALPMSDAQVASNTAHWQYNGNTGHRQLLWSCEIVDDPAECFSSE